MAQERAGGTAEKATLLILNVKTVDSLQQFKILSARLRALLREKHFLV